MDVGVVNKILNFADDTKIVSKVASEEQIKILQSDLHKMFNWSQDWQMLFNTDKSKVMHFGFNNKEVDHILGNQRLNAVEEERDVGVIVDKSLKSSKQCAKAAAAPNAVLGMIHRTFLCKDKELILQLCKSLVRPRLEYCIQVWRPYLKKDINLLERVQKRATKLISGLSEMGYEERLKILGLTTLVLARYGRKGKRYDMIDITQNIAIRYDTMHKRNVKLNALRHGHQFTGCEPGWYSRTTIAAKQPTRARAQTISNMVG